MASFIVKPASRTSAPQPAIPFDKVNRTISYAAKILSATWRVRITRSTVIHPLRDKNRGFIFSFWHSPILPIACAFRTCGVLAVVSANRDGERIAAVAQRWGCGTIRGFSSRQSLKAFRECVRALHSGRYTAVTRDGAREIAKPEIAIIAAATLAPLASIIARPAHAVRLSSWERLMIPAPYTRLKIGLRPPVVTHPDHIEPEGTPKLLETIQHGLLA